IIISREDCHAVPGTLALPDSAIAEGSKQVRGKSLIFGLKLLEANDIWLSFVEPSHEVFQPLVDVIDIEASDLHRSGLKPQRDCDLSECARRMRETIRRSISRLEIADRNLACSFADSALCAVSPSSRGSFLHLTTL